MRCKKLVESRVKSWTVVQSRGQSWKVVQSRGKLWKLVEIGESQGNFRMERGSRRKGALRDLPTLIFLSLLFFWGEKARKTNEKSKDFSRCRTPKIPGRKAKTLKKARKFVATKEKGNPKKQGKEDQAITVGFKGKSGSQKGSSEGGFSEGAQNALCGEHDPLLQGPFLTKKKCYGARIRGILLPP